MPEPDREEMIEDILDAWTENVAQGIERNGSPELAQAVRNEGKKMKAEEKKKKGR